MAPRADRRRLDVAGAQEEEAQQDPTLTVLANSGGTHSMNEASEAIARQVRNAVRETVSARRIQGAAGGGWTEKGISEQRLPWAPGPRVLPGAPKGGADGR